MAEFRGWTRQIIVNDGLECSAGWCPNWLFVVLPRLCRQHRSPATQANVPGGCDCDVQGRGLALVGGLGTAGRESTVTPVETLRAAGERGEGVGDAGMGAPAGTAFMQFGMQRR